VKNVRTYLLVSILVILAACAPSAVPAAPEVIYRGAAPAVYAAVVRAISTSPGLPNSNGWIIDQSDSAGGFVSARSTVSTFNLFTGPSTDVESVSVVVSPNGEERTAVVVQATPGAGQLAQRVRAALSNEFGQPISSTAN
jgi:hypothetical protein